MGVTYLSDFQSVLPDFRMAQADITNWLIDIHQRSEALSSAQPAFEKELMAKLFQRIGVKPEQIASRYTECSDILRPSSAKALVYQLSEKAPSGADIQQRALFFADKAQEVFAKYYNLSNKASRPDHIIHVTCTGYISPSAAQLVVGHQEWGKDTAVTHAYHMGCYASLPAIRLASALVFAAQDDQFKVDVAHNEMCSLHMNPQTHTPEQMVVQTLFADGHIKYTLSTQRPNRGYKLLAIHEKILPDSQADMSWIPAPHGMVMNLSREVPNKIKGSILAFTEELISKAGISYADMMEGVFAIHPGGPKIIESVKEVLELSIDQVSESKQVLFERGNMSSATLPHVWELISSKDYPAGTKVTSFAFGPGLTMFGSVFEVV
jgi:predicted naringenin-chalcone synthase